MDPQFPGKRLVERLERRTARRPRVGLSPAFYARFGLADPWLELGEGASEQEAKDAFSFVSARPFYQMMRRLALSRWRRERREKRWASRTAGVRTAARRRFPGEPQRGLHLFGVRTLGMSDMALPEPWTPPDYVAQGDQPSGAWGTATGTPVRVSRGSSAWISQGGSPARVAEKPERSAYEPMAPVRTRRVDALVARSVAPERLSVSRSADRPADRVGRRLQQTSTGRDPLRRALAEAAPRLDASSQRKVDTVLRRTEHLDVHERVVEVRRILRRVAGARVVRTVMEESSSAVGARPTEVARGRAAPEKRRRRGLRPILGSSPSMEVLGNEDASVAEQVSPWASRKPSQSSHAGARVIRGQQAAPQLSSSPVTKTPRIVRGPDRLAPSPVPRTAASAHVVRTESGAYTRARALRTATSAADPSATHRTTSRQDAAAGSYRTATSAADPSATHRTTSRQDAAAGSYRTASGDFTGTVGQRTASGEFIGARSGQTGSTDWTGATTSTTRASAHAATRAMRTRSSEFVGATSSTTDSGSTSQSRAIRTAKGAFTGARNLRTANGDWIGARTANWAAERLATTGTPESGRRSLMPHIAPRVGTDSVVTPKWAERAEVADPAARRSGPRRMAPRVDTDTVLEPMVATTDEEAAALAKKLRAERPSATVRIVERPWSSVPYQAAAAFKTRRSAAQKAADRAIDVPLVGEVASRALSSTWASPVAARTNETAERRMRGPVGYAGSSPVRDAHVVQHDDATEEGAAGPGFFRTASKRPEASRGVRTVSGDFQGASTHRTASRSHSAADWSPSASTPSASTARRMRTGGGAFMPTETWLTRSGDFEGARSGITAAGDFEGARLGHSRPMDWVGARVATGDTDAYRGAYARSFRTRSGGFTGAGVWQTPPSSLSSGPSVGARRAAGLSRPEMITPDAAERPELHELMAESQRGVPMRGAPGWAERATVPDRLRSTTDLVAGLVGATDPAEVIEIILARGNELKSSTLPKPVVQVIEQIRTEAWKVDDAERRSRAPSSGSAGSARSGRTGSRRGTRSARVLSGWTGLSPQSTASTTGAVGDDKVSKLAKKLRNLIHLAESARTGEALREARLAHADRPDARMTEGGDISNSESAAMANVDIEALGREVLEVVVRELELRQERRQEDNDGNIWW